MNVLPFSTYTYFYREPSSRPCCRSSLFFNLLWPLSSSLELQLEQAATLFRPTEKLFSSETHQSMKRRIATER